MTAPSVVEAGPVAGPASTRTALTATTAAHRDTYRDRSTTMNDQSLAETTPSPAEPPTGAPDGALPSSEMTIDEILNAARRVEKVAWICTRADLQAEHDRILSEMSLLLNDRGELLNEEENAVGESSAAARAAELNEELTKVRHQMADSMWSVRFRAKSSDDWAVFIAAHFPTKPEPDLRPFFNLLISECAIAPALSLEQVQKMRTVFSGRQMKHLSDTAWAANTGDGLDVPKLPSFSPDQSQG